ncbi:hypothetical protein JCM10449v2_003254 [Rhodotorula kratochvilovae]
MDSLSSALYSNLDFSALLPGLFKHGPAGAAPERAPAPTAATSTAPSAPRSAAQGGPSPAASSTAPEGMAKKRNGARNSKHAKHKGQQKKHGNAPAQQIKVGVTPSSAVTGPPHLASTSTAPQGKDGKAYPQQFYNDDLSAAPLFPPPRRPQPSHRELPRVELEEDRIQSPAYSSSEHDAGYYSAASYPGMHPADRKAPEYALDDDDDDQLSSSSAFSDSPSFAYSDDDYASDELDLDDDDDDEGSGSSAEDGPSDGFKLDESDERRPFPDPRLAKQQKYLRRTADDLDAKDKADVDAPAHVYVEAASPVSPQSPVVAPSHFAPTASYVPYVATAAPSAYPSASHATVHYAPVSGATYDDAADLAIAAEDFDPLDGPYPRGRSKHPRLLWRSALDRDALAVLDAHHERVRGGPLPRLALADGARLSASGVEREREHAGLEEDEVKERVRRARRRDRGAEGRRTWSQAGRKWSREIERVGL